MVIKPHGEFGWGIQTIVRGLVNVQANRWQWGYFGAQVKLEEGLSCEWALWLGMSYLMELVNGLPWEAFKQGWQELYSVWLAFLVGWRMLSELGGSY